MLLCVEEVLVRDPSTNPNAEATLPNEEAEEGAEGEREESEAKEISLV